MRKYEKKTATHTSDICVEQRCDLCGRAAKHPEQRWDGGIYDVNETEVEVTIKAEHGTSYPEGGQIDVCEVDICPMCFMERLIPWLESQGAKIRKRDVEW